MKAEKPKPRDDFGNAPEIIAEKEQRIKELEAEITRLHLFEDGSFDKLRNQLAEKDKEIAELKSHSRDFRKAEAIKLKKENELQKEKIRNYLNAATKQVPVKLRAWEQKGREQALSELRDEIEKIHHNWRYQIGIRSDRPRIIEANRKIPTQSSIITKEQFDTMWKDVLKAIDSRRTA